MKQRPTLDLRDLHCFVAVYELKGFARAAAALKTAQSNVSNRVRRLENFIGLPMFERRHRSIVPTKQGEQMYHSACRLLDDVDEFEADLRARSAA